MISSSEMRFILCVCSVGVLGPKNADGQYSSTTTVADAAVRGRGRAARPVKSTAAAAAATHNKQHSTSARMSTYLHLHTSLLC